MAEKEPRKIIPLRWLGIRDDIDPVALREDEWQDAMNMEVDGTRLGITEIVTHAPGVAVVGLHFYRRPDGTNHRVAVLANGTVWEDAGQVLSGLTGSAPFITSGLGAIVILDPSGTPRWRDPADGVWKNYPTPAAWPVRVASFDSVARRFFVAPTDLGPDSWGWSVLDKMSDFTKASGAGQEIVGPDDSPIMAIGNFVGESLAIYKLDRLYLREGADPTSWAFRAISADVGTDAPRVITKVGHGNFFIHGQSAGLLNAVGSLIFPPLSEPISVRWLDWAKRLDFTVAHATWDTHRGRMYLWLPDDAGVLQRMVSFDFKERSVTEHRLQATCSAWSGKYVTIGRTDGVIAEMRGSLDLTTPINAWLKTKVFGDPMNPKGFGSVGKVIVLLRGTQGVTVTVTPTIYVEGTTVAAPAKSAILGASLTRVQIPLPNQQGWGIEFLFQASGYWRLVGMIAPEEILGEI